MSVSNPANISAEVIASLPNDLRVQIPRYNETMQPNQYAAATICFVAVCVAIGLRLYSRRLKCQRLAWDDYMILIALVFYVPFYICDILSIFLGIGRHEVANFLEHPDRRVPSVKAALAGAVLSVFPLYFAKLSTLFLYNRIFGGASSIFTHICIGVGLVITGLHLSMLFLFLLACRPIDEFWDHGPGGHCIPIRIPFIVGAALFALSDATVLLMPMPYIWRMHTSLARKVQLTGTFLLGSFVVGVAILKACLIGRFDVTSTDPTWATVLPGLMGTLENGMGAVAACLPVLRPVYNKCIYGSVEGGTRRGTTTGNRASVVYGKDLWMKTIGSSRIAASRHGRWVGWTETTVVCEGARGPSESFQKQDV